MRSHGNNNWIVIWKDGTRLMKSAMNRDEGFYHLTMTISLEWSGTGKAHQIAMSIMFTFFGNI